MPIFSLLIPTSTYLLTFLSRPAFAVLTLCSCTAISLPLLQINMESLVSPLFSFHSCKPRAMNIIISRSVCRFVGRFVRTFSFEPWICGYVQRALGTTRVWNVVVKEQRVHGGGRLKFTLMCTFLMKAESGGYQTWICG